MKVDGCLLEQPPHLDKPDRHHDQAALQAAAVHGAARADDLVDRLVLFGDIAVPRLVRKRPCVLEGAAGRPLPVGAA